MKIVTKRIVFHPHSYGIATLMRVGVRFAGRQLVLHHFQPHQEVEFHDHPWPFRTVVLWGGYVDESLGPHAEVVRDELRIGSTRRRPARHTHRTSCTRHTVTLVLTGRKERAWCRGPGEPYLGGWVCDGDPDGAMRAWPELEPS